QQLPISEFEATLFGLGLYTDTGNFIYKNTTDRDLQMAAYLLKNGMNLEIVQRFSEQVLEPEQQQLFEQLRQQAETIIVDGLDIIVSSYTSKPFITGLSLLTTKLLEQKGDDVAILVVKIKYYVNIIGYTSSDSVNFYLIIQ